MARSQAEKMFGNPGVRGYVYQVPEDVKVGLGLEDARISTALEGDIDHAHVFVRTKPELQREFPRVKSHIAPGGQIWVSWPKGKQPGTDLPLHEVIAIGYAHGLVESTCLSINDLWSALRFTHPKPGKHYTNSHAELVVSEGIDQ